MMSAAPTFELVLTGDPTPRQFTAFVPDGAGGRVAEQPFEWRADSTALALDLGALARAAIEGHPPQNDLHRTFGRMLFDTVFAGAVGELWQARLAELKPKREPLRLVLRVDPATARPLLNLPWEYLHDGRDFLALNWRTPISRLPWGLEKVALESLGEAVRVLVLVAAPLGLSQNQVLNTAREEDLILAALGVARRAGRIDVAFAPDGALETLEAQLREFDPHVLHFVGHGVFVAPHDTGYLLMETPDGHQREVENGAFVQALERQARSLRLVFLSACQTAVAPRNEGYADLGPRLLEAGIPAVVAMQYSVLNRSAMAFGSAFYKGVADGDPLDGALTEARGRLAQEGLNTVDFATPVLFLADPACLRVEVTAFERAAPPVALDLTGVARAQQFVGRSAELRELQTNLDPERGRWRAAIVYGLGGMGKTVLAARLAERMAAQLHGAKAIRMSPTTTAQEVLDQIGDFLLLNNARLNHLAISRFLQAKDKSVQLESKAAALIEVLTSLRLLLIFDNYEDMLEGGRAVSRAAREQVETAAPGVDPDLPKLVALLVASVAGPSRFLFTSRVDFTPLEAGRLSEAVGHVSLGEMGFTDAVYLMETLPPLDRLPVAVLQEVRPGVEPLPRALSKRDVYERLGGHPYTLGLLAEHARRSSTEAVLADLAGVQKELVEFTLLERAAGGLPERARVLLKRAAIYDEPVEVEGLAFLMGEEWEGREGGEGGEGGEGREEADVMPGVEEEVQGLLGWGLVGRPPGEETYVVHTAVREWARGGIEEEERRVLRRRAAQYWLGSGRDSGDLGDFLRARHYLFLVGDYEQADDIVQLAVPYLRRWGQIELLLRLLGESVRTVSGGNRAVALGNLATVYRDLGQYGSARRMYEQVLAEFEALGARQQIAQVLRQLGMLDQDQGEYGRAQERYERALAIEQELGDRAGVAHSLHQLGMPLQLQGEYGRAQECYEQSLAILQELGDRAGVAISLHNLGVLHQAQGEYGRARECYEQSLAIEQELGDRAGVADSLYQLGVLHQLQGEYGRARECYEQSLAIKRELGNRAGVARSLHQLGRLHQLQGEYRRAQECYEQSLAIQQELGDRAGVAGTLHNLGTLHQAQGEYGRAQECYEQSLAILQELGDRAGVAGNLHDLGTLHQAQGEYGRARERYEQSLAIKRELGNRAGVAISLHNLGVLHQLQGEYGRAREFYEQSLAIKQELGSRTGVASSLHQLGTLHQLQGEYRRARELYEQSLAIEQETGNRAGVAISLHQLGRLCEEEGAYAQAIQYAAQALVIFEQLGAPEREQARRDLARVREKMGREPFEAALQQAAASAQTCDRTAASGRGWTVEQAVQAVVRNTVAVLTDVPGQRSEWWEALGQFQEQARAQGLGEFATFLGLLRQLVEGTQPGRLEPHVPPDFRQAWNAVVHVISKQEDQNG